MERSSEKVNLPPLQSLLWSVVCAIALYARNGLTECFGSVTAR